MPKRTRHAGYEHYYDGALIPKYRPPRLTGAPADRFRIINEEICDDNDLDPVEAELMPDNGPLFIGSPPSTAPSFIGTWVKDISARWDTERFDDRTTWPRSASPGTVDSIPNTSVEQTAKRSVDSAA